MKFMSLDDYITKYHRGNKSAFARTIKSSNNDPITRQQVGGWISKGFGVVISDDGIDVSLWSERRTL
jgi:hypothetical protein